MDALLDDVAVLDDILLVTESELSEDKSLIVFSAIRARSSSLITSLLRSVIFNLSLASFIIPISFEAS